MSELTQQQIEKKIYAAIRKILTDDREHEYWLIAEILNKRNVPMVMGGEWNVNSAKRWLDKTGATSARMQVITDKQEYINDSIVKIILRSRKRTCCHISNSLNDMGVKTMTGTTWVHSNVHRWLNDHPECRIDTEEAMTLKYRIKSVKNLLGMLGKQVYTDAAAHRAAINTINGLFAQGV